MAYLKIRGECRGLNRLDRCLEYLVLQEGKDHEGTIR